MAPTDPTLEPSPTRPPAWEAVAVIAGGLALILAVVVGLRWKPWAGKPMLSIVKPVPDAASGPYAGSKACAECHPGESALHGRSGHSRTLRPAATSREARRLDGRVVDDPEHPGVTWSYALAGGTFRATRADKSGGDAGRFVLEYAFGSGHHAATFLTVTDPHRPAATEHRLTYFALDDSLAITPGQRAANPSPGTNPHGRELSANETLKCFGCHATPASESAETPPGQAPVPDLGPLSPNVACERCHGPSRAHVEAARRGQPGRPMPADLAEASSVAQLGLCGQCHRHPSRFPRDRIRPDDPGLVRFQPVGLSQSKCYTQSGGAMRCSTCHDPHARSSTDRASYESACRTCHDTPRPADAKASTDCPVSPRGRCLDCHMPKVDSGQQILFTDHWIRVRKGTTPAREDRD